MCLGRTFQFLVILTVKMFFLSCVSTPAYCLLSFQWVPLRRASSLSITAPTLPSQVLVHMDKSPSEFSLLWLSQPFSCNLFLYVRFSSPLNIFVTPQWTCSRMYKTLLSWGAQQWTQHSQFVASVLSRMKESCIHPLKLCLKRRKALLGAQ